MNDFYAKRSERETASRLFLDIVRSALKLADIPRNGEEALLDYAGQFDLMFDHFYQIVSNLKEDKLYEYSRKREKHLKAVLGQLHHLRREMYAELIRNSFFGYPHVLENMLVSVEAQIRILESVASVYIEDNKYQNKIRNRLRCGQESLDLICEEMENGWVRGGQSFISRVSVESHERIIADRSSFQAALATLTERQRRRFVDYYIVGKTVKEIADEEGIREPSVRENIDTAMRHLMNIL